MAIDPTKAALRVENASKRYGGLLALDSVNLEVEPGEIFSLLGPNGAGKTTLIGCASGLIQDFDGRITIGGYDVRSDFRVTRRLVGLVPQELNFDGFFSVRQALYYQTGYFGVRPTHSRIEEILRTFSLLDKADTNTRQLSGGMKRRLMVCKALMHEPALLFLDEPTAGVDVELREELWEVVLKLRSEGVTVVLTTHYLEEAEKLSDRIGIINKGRIIRAQPRNELIADLGRRWLEVSFSKPVTTDEFERLGANQIGQVSENRLRFEVDGGSADENDHIVAAVVDRAREKSLTVVDVAAGRSSLEQVFKGILRDDKGRKV